MISKIKLEKYNLLKEELKDGYLLLDVYRVSSKRIQELREKFKSENLKVKVVPNGIFKKIVGDKISFKGSGFLILGDLTKALKACRDLDFLDQRYPKIGQIASSDYEIKPQMTSIKLSGNLGVLQNFLGVKPQKGFIEITRGCKICTAGDKISADVAKITRLLKVKTQKTNLKILHFLNPEGQTLGEQTLKILKTSSFEDPVKGKLSTRIVSELRIIEKAKDKISEIASKFI